MEIVRRRGDDGEASEWRWCALVTAVNFHDGRHWSEDVVREAFHALGHRALETHRWRVHRYGLRLLLPPPRPRGRAPGAPGRPPAAQPGWPHPVRRRPPGSSLAPPLRILRRGRQLHPLPLLPASSAAAADKQCALRRRKPATGCSAGATARRPPRRRRGRQGRRLSRVHPPAAPVVTAAHAALLLLLPVVALLVAFAHRHGAPACG
ncbi:hypothetical protein ACP4OV_013423 [Aristida adscensionis]